MAKLTKIEKGALDRAIESIKELQDGISEDGDCELEGSAYDYASLKLIEAKHWLDLLIESIEA